MGKKIGQTALPKPIRWGLIGEANERRDGAYSFHMSCALFTRQLDGTNAQTCAQRRQSV